MSDSPQVYPLETVPMTPEEDRRQRFMFAPLVFGCLAMVLFFSAIGIVIAVQTTYFPNFFEGDDDQTLVKTIIGLCVFGAVVLAAIIASIHSTSRYKANVRSLIERREKEALQESWGLTRYLTRIHASAPELRLELEQHVAAAGHLIQQAERDYEDNAFGPFWDSIEKAALHLDACRTRVDKIGNWMSYYYGKLAGRIHTFPAFPLSLDDLPTFRPLVHAYLQLVRKGQTNFQFALIWEERKTRSSIIQGFQSMGDAIGEVGIRLEGSVDAVRESLDRGFAGLAESQRAVWEEIERRLL